MKLTSIAIATATIAVLGTASTAQTLGTSTVDNQITTLNDNIAEDFSRATMQSGNDGRTLGFDGSIAMQANASSGNTDTTNIGIGADLGFYDGQNGYQLQLSYQYSEDEGTVSKDSWLYDLEYTRDFSPSYYGFAKLQGGLDSFPASTSDNFLGLGVGFNIYDSRDVQWSVQAGAGYRVADLDSIEDLGEGAISLSSNYFNAINDQMFLTNDTDIITSESDTVVYNDLGLNVSMTDALALRASVKTEYHTEPAAGMDDTDNTFGLSLVYSLN